MANIVPVCVIKPYVGTQGLAGTALISVMVPGDTARAETWVLLPGHTAIGDVGGSHVADIPWAVEWKSLIIR